MLSNFGIGSLRNELDFSYLDEVEIQQFIQEAIANEDDGDVTKWRQKEIKVLDGVFKKMNLTFGEVEDSVVVTKCVLKLKKVVIRSKDQGVEDLGNITLVDNCDDEGFQFAY